MACFTSMTWVDVRDVAEGLAAAAEKEEAGGERIVVSHGPWNGEDICERYVPLLDRRLTGE